MIHEWQEAFNTWKPIKKKISSKNCIQKPISLRKDTVVMKLEDRKKLSNDKVMFLKNI